MPILALLAALLAGPASAVDLCLVPELQDLRRVKIAFSKKAEDGSSSLRRELRFYGCQKAEGFARWMWRSSQGDLHLEIVFLDHQYALYHSQRQKDPSWRWIYWTMSSVVRRDPDTDKLGENVFTGGSLCFNNHLSLLQPAPQGCGIRYPHDADHPGSPAPAVRYGVHIQPRF